MKSLGIRWPTKNPLAGSKAKKKDKNPMKTKVKSKNKLAAPTRQLGFIYRALDDGIPMVEKLEKQISSALKEDDSYFYDPDWDNPAKKRGEFKPEPEENTFLDNQSWMDEPEPGDRFLDDQDFLKDPKLMTRKASRAMK